MKKLLFSFIISLLMITSFYAQTIPQGMKYQAVARDLSGEIIEKQPISLKIQLLGEFNSSQIYYEEVHNVTTNQFGLFSLVVGQGNVEKDVFTEIPWDKENIWMHIAIKTGKEANYTSISNSKLMAVPYAFHAATASQLTSEKSNNGNVKEKVEGVPSQNWSLFGNSKSDSERDKLGTTDEVDLVFVTDNIERMRLLNSGELEVRENAQFDKNVNIDGITKTDYLVVADEANDTITDIYPRDGSIVDVRGLFIADSIAIKGGLDIGGNLSVHGDRVEIDKDLYVGRNVHLNTNDQFSPQGETINHGKFTSNGQVTINTITSLIGGDSDYDAYPLRVEGSDQGIAIKVNGSRDNSNNFVTFWDDNGRQGRIEGQTENELKDSFEWWWFKEQKILNTTFNTLMIAADLWGADDGDAAAVEGLQFIDIISHWIAWNNNLVENVGVTYESGSGDYAEWLEKANNNETFSYGDIVGVNGGEISKNLLNANKFMVVSKSPIVLGNMPTEGKEANYEKIAFMGQVPVKVRGKVNTGDYIIASDLNDGIGTAVDPKAITLDQFERIVGVAWSESFTESTVSMVNCAVGINTNDVVIKLKQQQEELNEVKTQMNTILTYLKSKDESFNAALFSIKEKETKSSEPNIEIDNQNVFDRKKMVERFNKRLNENPNFIKQIQANARKILDERGVDYNRYDQTKRLLTDESYFISLIQNLDE